MLRLPAVVGREQGMALVEFQIVALLGLLPFTFALLQVALLLAGAAQLDYVAFEAARAGTMAEGDRQAIRRAAVRAMIPQMARFDVPLSAANVGEIVARGWARAEVEAAVHLSLESDTPEQGLLRVRVTYCHPLYLPLVPAMLVPVLRRLDPVMRHQQCYADSRIPVVAEAVLAIPAVAGAVRPSAP